MSSRPFRVFRVGLLIAIAAGGILASGVYLYRLRPAHVPNPTQPSEAAGELARLAPSAVPTPQQVPGPSYKCARGLEANGDQVFQGGGTLRVNGFTIEIKPRLDASGSFGIGCDASIRSPRNEVIFEGYNDVGGFDIDPVTGKDLNGDGEPDAVLVEDSGSVHYDNFGYSIISLGRKPGPIQGLEGIGGFKDLKGDGRMEILDGESLLGLHGLSTAESPYALIILRLSGSRFEDVGPEFPNIYDEDIKREIRDLKDRVDTAGNDVAGDSNQQQHVLSIVLDYVYSGRPKEARKALDQYWPADDSKSVRKEIIERYCGGERKQLGLATDPTCMAGDF